MSNMPTLPIKQFQFYKDAIYVLDVEGRVWGSDDFVKGQKWYDYTSQLAGLPVPQCPPPTEPQ